MKKIPLHRKDGSVGDYALVSDEDYPALSQFPWHKGGTGYAARRLRVSEGGGGRSRTVMVYMHREVLGLPRSPGHSAPQGNHLNFNRLDNQRENLEVVTPGENLIHGWAARKTETCRTCGGNDWVMYDGTRRCVPCRRKRAEDYRRGKGIPPRAPVTHCRRAGHEYTPENTFVNAKGYRECIACRDERATRARAV